MVVKMIAQLLEMLKPIVSPLLLRLEITTVVSGFLALWLLQATTPDFRWFWIASIVGALVTIIALIVMALVLQYMMSRSNLVFNEHVLQENKKDIAVLRQEVDTLKNTLTLEHIEKNEIASQLKSAVKDLQESHRLLKECRKKIN